MSAGGAGDQAGAGIASEGEDAARRARFVELMAIVALLALLLFVRAPAHTERLYNVDEAQYLATAAFLSAGDESLFDHTDCTIGAVGVYRLLSVLSEPYAMLPARVAVTLLCALMTAALSPSDQD